MASQCETENNNKMKIKNHNTSLMSTSRLTKSLYFMKIFRPSKRKILLPFANAYTQRQQCIFRTRTPNGLGVQHMCSCSFVDLLQLLLYLPRLLMLFGGNETLSEYSSKTPHHTTREKRRKLIFRLKVFKNENKNGMAKKRRAKDEEQEASDYTH